MEVGVPDFVGENAPEAQRDPQLEAFQKRKQQGKGRHRKSSIRKGVAQTRYYFLLRSFREGRRKEETEEG